ncbi:MAG: DUF1731 domain-containing protein, partial [Puniceicoccales bacterium]
EGGALGKLLPIFKAGMGGRIGSGQQPFPWISLSDYVQICQHLLFHSEHSGPVNLVSPGIVTNQEFVRSLGALLKRPTMIPVPKAAVRLAFGEMGTSTLLEGVDAAPSALLADSYRFIHPELSSALAEILVEG